MSVLQALYKTYNLHADKAGKVQLKTDRQGNSQTYTLLPMSHTTQTAQIEIAVTEAGDFHSAKVIPKVSTVIPFISAKAAKPLAHGLHEKLMYCAGDYVPYTGQITKTEPFMLYITNLQKWVESDYTHPDIQAIYQYVLKGTVIRDLINEQILYTDNNGMLLEKYDGKEKPEIFKLVTKQEEAFVRFRVHSPHEEKIPPWENQELFTRYSQYLQQTFVEEDLCYITGEWTKSWTNHPSKIRHAADMGKLISANDHTGFTYRGRFGRQVTELGSNFYENAAISYEASQKVHNALKWLIEQQGVLLDGRVYLVWGEQQEEVAHFLANDALEMPEDDSDFFAFSRDSSLDEIVIAPSEQVAHTHQVLKNKFKKRLYGMYARIDDDDFANQQIHILTLDAATTGRLGVLSYRTLHAEDYFTRLAQYQVRACWIQTVWKDKKRVPYIQAPSLRDIADFVYGPRPNEKVVKQTMERLIPIVLDNRSMPFDIVQKALARASNPQSFEHVSHFERGVEIACAIMKHHFIKEGYTVALNTESTNRSYLYGRLLAVAEIIEKHALNMGEDKRTTNAMRYMNAFQMNPARTWLTIYSNLLPYRQKLGGKGTYYERVIQDIIVQFDEQDFMSNKALDGQYLLGFYSQQKAFYTKKEAVEGE